MKIQCPHCGVRGTLDDAYIHKKIRCPKCSNVFRAESEGSVTDDTPPPPPIAEPVVPPVVPIKQTEPTHPGPVLASNAASEERSAGSGSPPSPSDELSQKDQAGAESAPPHSQPSITEAQVHEELDSLFTETMKCSGCGKVASDQESYIRSTHGFLCPHCHEQSSFQANWEKSQQEQFKDQHAPNEDTSRQSYWQKWANQQQNAADATAGNEGKISFSVSELVRNAWDKTNGVKREIWIAIAIAFSVSVACGLFEHLLGIDQKSGLVAHVIGFVLNIPSYLFSAGIMYMGVEYAFGKTISWRMITSGFPVAKNLIIAVLLQTVLVSLGLLLLIVPGIYLSIGYSMTLPLIIDKGLSPWEAMEESRKTIHPIWWNIFALYLLVGALFAASIFTLFLGLIWLLPWSVVLMGLLYRILFPVHKQSVT